MTAPRVLLLFACLLLASVLPAIAADWEMTSVPNGYQYRLAVDPTGHVYAVGGAWFYVSANDGASWDTAGASVPGSFAKALAISPSGSTFVGDNARGIFRSDDGTSSWSDNIAPEGCNSLAVNSQGVLFAGLTYTGNGKVYRSTDNGAHWLSVNLPNASNSFATECFAFGDGDGVFAGTIDGFYRSDDLGLTWVQRNGGLLGLHVRTMTRTPAGHVFVYTLYPAALDGLYRSTDRGDTWQRLGGNAPYFSSLVAAANGELYGASESAVYRSTDDGLTWTSLATGIPAYEQLTSVVITPTGRVLTGGSHVYRSTWSVAGVEPPTAPEGELRLAQNRPNPFGGVTSITYALSRRSSVDLAVFDISGRRVATLAEGAQEAGEHTVSCEGSSLAAGLYLYRLRADGIVRSRRFLMLP